ncbi:PH domain-containing protein [Frankia sp. R82]|uniref:PH domain-containing protein n=1 Tax=Frankia sp. R82 TaxID=2950553 RepID=UPI0020439533|nr:PH domain-containing protein [Frankia sp. R82]MCM3883601.1 PH domain-containing protein [Frankia sp. R82]
MTPADPPSPTSGADAASGPDPASGAASDSGADSASWSPPLWRVALYAAGCALVALVAAIGSLAARLEQLDGAGRLLLGVVAAGLGVLAVRDLLARPTLRVDPGGLDLVDGLRRRQLPWAAVLRVRAGTVTHNRRAVHLRTLEVETIDGPILLTRRQLGADPGPIAERIERIRLRSH